MEDIKTIGQIADSLTFATAEKIAGRNDLLSYSDWMDSEERRRDGALPWRDDVSRRNAYIGYVRRTLDWLERNGKQVEVGSAS